MRRSAYVHALGADQLELLSPARPSRLLLPFVGVALWSGAVALISTTAVSLALLTVGAVLLPILVVRAVRSSRPKRNVLVRAPGRLLLDGEPLEVARVELRVVKHWLLRTPKGYVLSLWALVGRGDPVDVELGRFTSILEASLVSGQMEDFLERARARAPGRASAGD